MISVLSIDEILSSPEKVFSVFKSWGEEAFSSYFSSIENQSKLQKCFSATEVMDIISKHDDVGFLKVMWSYFKGQGQFRGSVYACACKGAVDCIQYLENHSVHQLDRDYLIYSVDMALREQHFKVLDYFKHRAIHNEDVLDEVIAATFNFGQCLEPDHPGREYVFAWLTSEHNMLRSVTATLDEHQIEWTKKLWPFLNTNKSKKTAILNACFQFNDEAITWMLTDPEVIYQTGEIDQIDQGVLSPIYDYLKSHVALADKKLLNEATSNISKSIPRRSL